MIAYIIKRDDGLYLNEIYQKYVDAYELSEQFRVFHNVNCKPVKVEIKEVEEV